MKSIVKNKNTEVKQEVKFPCLMIGNNSLIVMFLHYDWGVVVSKGDTNWSVGDHMKSGWAKTVFKPFNGTVELSN